MAILLPSKRWRQLFAFTVTLIASQLSAVPAVAASVGNFTLLDERGHAAELHYYRDSKAIVLVGYRSESEFAAQTAIRLEELQNQFGDEDVTLFLIDLVAGETREDVQSAKQRQNINAAVLMDDTQLVSETLGLSYAGEVLVISPKGWQIAYRGPITQEPDNAVTETVRTLVNGDTVAATAVEMNTAYEAEKFSFQTSIHDNISYSNTIAPLLKEKCATCHRPGGIAPWAMTSHAMVQGFSPMIREVILTKRMPPWHADPYINKFEHDMGLSIDEAQTLVHWIDAGATRGEGVDPLDSVGPLETEWELGTPDLIVDLPAFNAPATGTVDYQFFEADNPLDHDVWVRAVQIVPGDRQVLHHAIATFGTGVRVNGIDNMESAQALFQSQLMTFVPGNETYVYPEGTGVLVPAGAKFFTQMHYTTYGKETTDKTRIGLYFANTPPEYTLQHYAIVNLDIAIPPGEAEHEEVAYYEFRKDAIVYSLFPHSHYRGRSSTFTLRYPDGEEELVLSVPNYDFNWQRYFQLAEPLNVPAGSRLIHRTVYDNSSANQSNPDATKRVKFGEQTWEEMLYGGVSFRYANKEDDVQEIDSMEYMTSISMGFMDKNLNGKIELNEMPEQARKSLAMAFVILDKDKSGGLEFLEFQQLLNQDNAPRR